MSYVFDASSIIRLISEKRVGVLGGNYTVPLAKFELGNTVWKYVILHKTLSEDEGLRLINIISEVLTTMDVIDVDEVEVEKVALTYKLSFYDASYVQLAIGLSLPLVTEDKKLKEKVRGKINVTSADEVTP
ncbi:type II toxin-antitoxin system VapC family toxin [Stygiolobus caldivivus]|uniref:PIN domain nuclease n=1 Tax=Stygiolobus caldivivus TaxID=2824673 RepID=A0A8D5U6N7_9CREN|nr:type II toxin-antitoxin system VapC family toxin [Stygiolobus caldivivus]BCU69982.1 PIN domain nuclease [Stygiolobus caldivivus]